jgi:beta-galactosidase
MYVGVDYYPEHWPRARWDTDARLMREAGFNVVRLAEFAWVMLEPEEGRFTFDWLDDALGVLADHGISAILGTPTAVMPAWVARKYPETLAMRDTGRRITWGVRKNNCFTSGTYRLLSERITRAMAEHFAGTPNVIGWQTDNEFGHPKCFCPTCQAEFQDWLRAKYGTLDALNAAWGLHFWGHLYGTWGEIQLPVESGGANPSALLDWQRFFSWLNVRFQHDQVAILRAAAPGHFITHNFMGLFSDLNYYDLAAELDHVCWDNYPVWGAPHAMTGAAAAADVMRGLKRQNFWIMEQTAGPGGWGSFGRNPWPGELRLVAYQQLAHGADGQIWFRWRTCTAGREQYWHGLLQHDGSPLRRYREAAQVAGEYHRLAPHLADTTVQAEVAFIYDYESIWALQFQPGYDGNTYHAAMQRYYDAFLRAGVNVDMVPPGADLSGYKIVVAADLHILPDMLAERLAAFVRNGGVLLADCRTGVKTETNLCHDRTLPGLLSEPLGISIEEYDAVPKELAHAIDGALGTHTAHQYVDWVTPAGAETLARYTDAWHLADFAAATRHHHGAGTGYYVGTVVQQPAFYDALIADMLHTAGVSPLLAPPAGVEVSVRAGAGKTLIFLLNTTQEAQTVALPHGLRDLLADAEAGRSITLERFGVAVLAWAKEPSDVAHRLESAV